MDNIFDEVKNDKTRSDEQIIYNIARAYTFIYAKLSRFLSAYGLSTAKFNILLTVKHIGKDKGISQNKISKHLLVTTSNMTRMIDKLEKEGHVKRVAREKDRRVNLIQITNKGEDLLNMVWPFYKKEVNNLINSKFSTAEKNQIIKLFTKFAQ